MRPRAAPLAEVAGPAEKWVSVAAVIGSPLHGARAAPRCQGTIRPALPLTSSATVPTLEAMTCARVEKSVFFFLAVRKPAC